MDLEKIAKAVTKGIAYTENGGKVDLANPVKGKTGEMRSIFQFEPATWKLLAKKYLNDENAPMNADTESFVTYNDVLGKLKKGMTIRQVASSWNAGNGEPDAYTGKFSDGSPSAGTNKKYGVKFDVPGYANKVLDYSKKFLTDEQAKNAPQASMTQKDDVQGQIMSMINQAKAKKAPLTPDVSKINKADIAPQPLQQSGQEAANSQT